MVEVLQEDASTRRIGRSMPFASAPASLGRTALGELTSKVTTKLIRSARFHENIGSSIGTPFWVMLRSEVGPCLFPWEPCS